MDVVKRTHDFQQASLVNFGSARGNNCQESPHYLELDLLVTLCCALIHLIYNGIDKPSGQSSITLWSFLFGIKTIVRVISIH